MDLPSRHEVAVYFGLREDTAVSDTWERGRRPPWHLVATALGFASTLVLAALIVVALSGRPLTAENLGLSALRVLAALVLLAWLAGAAGWLRRRRRAR